jgi:molecular chaperone GrpE
MTNGPNGKDDDDHTPAATETEPEPKGLAPVDGSPLAPLDREGVEALRRERDELKDQLLRKRADFENYRKRVERDRQQAGAEAVAAVFRTLIPSLDNLERALQARAGEEPLREGVELIKRDLVALLRKHGVQEEDPLGQRFDPEAHQALSHEHVPGAPEGQVVEVFRKGYSFQDRLLRPALVKVAKGPDGPEGSNDGGPDAVH